MLESIGNNKPSNMNYQQSRLAITICLLLATMMTAGCSQSSQEKYNDALNHLSDTKKTAQKAQDKVDDAKDKVADAKKKLAEAKKNLKEAQQKVAKARKSVDQTVNDDVLFRTLQKKMLNDDAFSDAAISVGVNHRVVTLTGNVPDQDTKQKAVKTAQQQTGVAQVHDQLEVTRKQNDSSEQSAGSKNSKDAKNSKDNNGDSSD